MRGDLEGEAAKSLVAWASAKVEAAAADPARPDDAVEAEVQTIRATARQIARSGEHDPHQVIALAEAALGEAGADVQASTAPAVPVIQAEPPRFPVSISDVADETVEPQLAVLPAPSPVPPSRNERRAGWRLGERLRRWFRRKDM